MEIQLPSDGQLVVGRSAGSGGVVVSDPQVSRVHFEITPSRDGRNLQIRDLDSRNGTKLNGNRVEVAPLAHGDIIRAGDSLLVYSEGMFASRIASFVQRASQSSMHILILGESGVGKEVLARRIHDASARTGPFVAVNCAAVPRDLLVSELCGHVRGSFSGAQQSREGLFSTARGGTIMLDEIGDMAIELQPALLRILETRSIRPVGSDREYPIDVRVIAATNAKLPSLVEAGAFRGDLYARLAQLVIDVPPLRARREEILSLADEFGRDDTSSFEMEADVAEALLLWCWPYNVRELQSLIMALKEGAERRGPVRMEDVLEVRPDLGGAVPSSRKPAPKVSRSADVLSDRVRLAEALREARGNVAQLARSLGTSRSQVYRWLRRWDLAADAVQHIAQDSQRPSLPPSAETPSEGSKGAS